MEYLMDWTHRKYGNGDKCIQHCSRNVLNEGSFSGI